MSSTSFDFFHKLDIPKTKIPQNVISVIKDLGENSVLFLVYLITRGTDWKVYKNLGETGCDIVLSRGTEQIKIEVKTRQRLSTTARNQYEAKRQAQFELSKLELDCCDLVIGFWFEKNSYFLFSKDQFEPSTAKADKFKLVVKEIGENGTTRFSTGFVNNWDYLKDLME